MKKILLSLACGAFGLLAQAQTTRTYTDNLTVTINDESSPGQQAEILVTDNGNGTFDIELKNFSLSVEDDVAPVGNILVQNISGEEANGYTALQTEQVIQIAPGDLDGVSDEEWLGPMLGDVPIAFNGKLTSDKMYCTIDIDMMESLGQIIYVVFGTDNFSGDGIKAVKGNRTGATVNVYTLQGTLVKTGAAPASALDGLKKGIYVVDGRKVIKQ